MRLHGRNSGAYVIVDGDQVRLQVWGKHFDEFVVLKKDEAQALASQLIAAVIEMQRLK